jgi:phage terminase large subunit-like protein
LTRTLAIFILGIFLFSGGNAMGKAKPLYPYEQWSGKRPIGRLERLCYERHERDLKTGHKRGLWFDETAADRAEWFFPNCVRHYDGKLVGKPFDLIPWERFVVRSLFGWKKLPQGVTATDALKIAGNLRGMQREKALQAAGIFRRFSKALIELPKKNGKSPFMSAICLYCLVMDGEHGAQIRSAATKREQARIIFDGACKMVEKSPEIKKRTGKPFKTAIILKKLNADFKPVSAEAGGEDGMNPLLAVIDELHRQASPALMELLENSLGGRDQSLLLTITTAGEEGPSVWRTWHEEAEKVLDQIYDADEIFAYMTGADKEDDWQLTETHIKANPSWGITIKPDKVRQECDAAIRTPDKRPAFLRYRLNRVISLAQKWMDMDKWASCAESYTRESLRGRPCYLGIDLSARIDLTAITAIFPPVDNDLYWRVWPWAWVPENNIEQRVKKDLVRYDVWVQDGFLKATPGYVVDYSYPEDLIAELSKEFDILEVAFDPNNATKFYTDMENKGEVPCVLVSQNYTNLSSPMKEIRDLIWAGKFRHPNHPVLNWCMSNVITRTKERNTECMPSGDIMPDKGKSKEKIDIVSAMVTAMSRAVVHEEVVSPYDDRGFISL